MKRFHSTRAALLASLACALVSAGGALAQPSPTTPPDDMHGRRDPMAMHRRMQDKRADHLKAFHDALNIRADQETAFAAFAAAMSPPPGAWGRRDHGNDRPVAVAAAMTTPQRLDRMAQRMDERSARMKQAFERRAAAAKALYAALSPDQQHTMDALHGLLGHEHGRRDGHDDRDGHEAWGAARG
jgi:protein CpxP